LEAVEAGLGKGVALLYRNAPRRAVPTVPLQIFSISPIGFERLPMLPSSRDSNLARRQCIRNLPERISSR